MSLKLTPSVEAFRIAQKERNAIQHEKNMKKYSWIRETVNAYNDADETQIATVEAIINKKENK